MNLNQFLLIHGEKGELDNTWRHNLKDAGFDVVVVYFQSWTCCRSIAHPSLRTDGRCLNFHFNWMKGMSTRKILDVKVDRNAAACCKCSLQVRTDARKFKKESFLHSISHWCKVLPKKLDTRYKQDGPGVLVRTPPKKYLPVAEVYLQSVHRTYRPTLVVWLNAKYMSPLLTPFFWWTSLSYHHRAHQ